MLGIALLLLALYLYFKPKYRYLSYLIYLSFMLGYGGGFGLTTDDVLGVKNMDMAIVYTFFISLYLIIHKKYTLPRLRVIKLYKVFLLFLICSVAFHIFIMASLLSNITRWPKLPSGFLIADTDKNQAMRIKKVDAGIAMDNYGNGRAVYRADSFRAAADALRRRAWNRRCDGPDKDV